MENIIVKVNNATKTIAEHQVVAHDGVPTLIKAKNNVNYELLDQNTGLAPVRIITKRVGNDLHISMEEDIDNSDLIIEGFYNNDNAFLIGLTSDSNYYYYLPDTGETTDYIAELLAGDIEGQILGGQSKTAPWWVDAVDTQTFNIAPWLTGIGGLGLTGALLASNNDEKDKGSTDAPVVVPNTPPVADSGTTDEDSSILIDVLANDTDPDSSDILSLTDVSLTQGLGVVSIENNQLRYDSQAAYQNLNDGENASVTVSYTMTDSQGVESTSTATLIVTGSNDAPVVNLNDDKVSMSWATRAEQGFVNTNDLIDNLGGDVGLGEQILPNKDDNFSKFIDLSDVFGDGLDFYGKLYGGLYVNDNGSVTFDAPDPRYTPEAIGGQDLPMFAIFWADVNTQGEKLQANNGGNSKGTNSIHYDLDKDNGILTITWDDVGYFGQTNGDEKRNSFQMQIIDQKEGSFDVIYRYESIDWTTGLSSSGINGLGGTSARMGWTAADDEHFFELPISGNSEEMANLEDLKGNTDTDGVWKFSVRNGNVLAKPSIVVDVLANDENMGLELPLTLIDASVVTGEGVVSIVNNKLEFAPSGYGYLAAGEIATAVLSYIAIDSKGNRGKANVEVEILGVGLRPDQYDAYEDRTVVFDPLENDNALGLEITNARVVDGAGEVIIKDNQIAYTLVGPDELTPSDTQDARIIYETIDKEGVIRTEEINVTIYGTDEPEGIRDTISIFERQEVIIDALGNDIALNELDSLELTKVEVINGQGTARISNGKLIYSTGDDYSSMTDGEISNVQLKYDFTDNKGGNSHSYVDIEVKGLGNVPVASRYTVEVEEDSIFSISDVLQKISPAYDGDTIKITNAYFQSDSDYNYFYRVTTERSQYGEFISLTDSQIIYGAGGQDSSLNEGYDFHYETGDLLKEGETANRVIQYDFIDNRGNKGIGYIDVVVKGRNDPTANADRFEVDEAGTYVLDVLQNDDNGLELSPLLLPIAYNPSVFVINFKGSKSVGEIFTSAVITSDNKIAFSINDMDDLNLDDQTEFEITYVATNNNGGWVNQKATVIVNGKQDPLTVKDVFIIPEDEIGRFDVLANDIVANRDNSIDVDLEITNAYLIPNTSANYRDLGITPRIVDNKITLEPFIFSNNDINKATGYRFGEDRLKEGETLTIKLGYTVRNIVNNTYTSEEVDVIIEGKNNDPILAPDEITIKEYDRNILVDVLANDLAVNGDLYLYKIQAWNVENNRYEGSSSSSSSSSNRDNKIEISHGLQGRIDEGQIKTFTIAYQVKDNKGGFGEELLTVNVIGEKDPEPPKPPTYFEAIDDRVAIKENGIAIVDVLANDVRLAGADEELTLTGFGIVYGYDRYGNPITDEKLATNYNDMSHDWSNHDFIKIVNNNFVIDPIGLDYLNENQSKGFRIIYTAENSTGATASGSLNLDILGSVDPLAVMDEISVGEHDSIYINPILNDIPVNGLLDRQVKLVGAWSIYPDAISDNNYLGQNQGNDLIKYENNYTYYKNVYGAPGIVQIVGNQILYIPQLNKELSIDDTLIKYIEYAIEDSNGGYQEGRIKVNIVGEADPVTQVDRVNVIAGQGIVIDPLGNDTAAQDGRQISLQSVSFSKGSDQDLRDKYLTIEDGKVVFLANPLFADLQNEEKAAVELYYTVIEEGGNSSIGTIIVSVTGRDIQTVPDELTVIAGEDAIIDVIANDTLALEGHELTLVGQSGDYFNPITGRVEYFNLDPRLSVVNNKVVVDTTGFGQVASGDVEDVEFTYVVQDEAGETAFGQLSVHVQGVDIDANSDSYEIFIGDSINLNVLANDSHSLGRDLSIVELAGYYTDSQTGETREYKGIKGPEGYGKKYEVTLNDDNEIIFTTTDFLDLNEGDTQDFVIDYLVTDGKGEFVFSQATVKVVGTGINAVDDYGEISENGYLEVDVLSNDILNGMTDVSVEIYGYDGYVFVKDNKVIFDWDSLKYPPMEWLKEGETETYDIEYTLSYANGGRDTATITLTVTGEDDPTANPDAFVMTVGQNQLIDVLSNDIALNNSSNLNVVSAEITNGYWRYDYGNVSIVNNQVLYNADSRYLLDISKNYSNYITIKYGIMDENGGYSSSTVNVTVKPFEATQIVADQAVSVSENDSVILDLLANDTRDSNITLKIDNIQVSSNDVSSAFLGDAYFQDGKLYYNPSKSSAFNTLGDNESAEVTISYTVNSIFEGAKDDSKQYQVSSTNSSIIINVAAAPDPIAVNETFVINENDKNITIDVLANDIQENPTLDLSIDNVNIFLNDTNINDRAKNFINITEDNKFILSPRYQVWLNSLEKNAVMDLKVQYDVIDSKGGRSTATLDLTVNGEDDTEAEDSAIDVYKGRDNYVDITSYVKDLGENYKLVFAKNNIPLVLEGELIVGKQIYIDGNKLSDFEIADTIDGIEIIYGVESSSGSYDEGIIKVNVLEGTGSTGPVYPTSPSSLTYDTDFMYMPVLDFMTDPKTFDMTQLEIVILTSSGIAQTIANDDLIISYDEDSGFLKFDINSNIQLLNHISQNNSQNSISVTYNGESQSFDIVESPEDDGIINFAELDLDLSDSILFDPLTNLSNNIDYDLGKVWLSVTDQISAIDDINRIYGLSIVNDQILFEPTPFAEILFATQGYVTVNYQVNGLDQNVQDFVSSVEFDVYIDNIDDPQVVNDPNFYSIIEGDSLDFDILSNVMAVDGTQERQISLEDCFIISERGINFDAISIVNNTVNVDSSFLGDIAADESVYASLYYSVNDGVGGQAYGSYNLEVVGI